MLGGLGGRRRPFGSASGRGRGDSIASLLPAFTASEQQLREAETQFELCKLARATGCPDQMPVIPWLLERGLVVEHPDGGYVMTAKAGPRAAAPNK